MNKDQSPLDTLRQLKEWLDAGTITPTEFETLKRKLLFDEKSADKPAASSITAPPADDPLLPPIVLPPLPPDPAPLAAPQPDPPTAPALPTESLQRPIEAGRPTESETAPGYYTPKTPPAEPPLETPVEEELLPPAPEPRNPLAMVLIIGGIVALLALMAYLLLGNRESERLTSTSRTEADSLTVQPEVGPQAEQIELPPVVGPETVRVAPAVPPTPVATTPTDTVTKASTIAPATLAADEATAKARIQSALTAYYDDLKEAPFNADQHFAPTVERYFTMQNTTPAAINEELTKTHFPEFTEAATQIEPGSLKVGPVANDGTRVVTYLEKGNTFRQSLQKHQQTTAQVRIRFNSDYKIVYLRQEKLLENVFTD